MKGRGLIILITYFISGDGKWTSTIICFWVLRPARWQVEGEKGTSAGWGVESQREWGEEGLVRGQSLTECADRGAFDPKGD